MSDPLLITCVAGRAASTFARNLFEEIFCRHAIAPKLPLLEVTYLDGGATEIYGGDEDPIETISFHRFGGDTFWAAIFELARRTGSVVYWPGEPPWAAIVDSLIVEELPEGFKEPENGQPILAANPKELEQCFIRSREAANRPNTFQPDER